MCYVAKTGDDNMFLALGELQANVVQVFMWFCWSATGWIHIRQCSFFENMLKICLIDDNILASSQLSRNALLYDWHPDLYVSFRMYE